MKNVKKRVLAAVLTATVAVGAAFSGCFKAERVPDEKTTYSYMVSYYFENKNGQFELGKSESKKIALSDSSYAVRVPNFEGYTFDEDNVANVTTLELQSAGVNVYYLYYEIAEYTVTALAADGSVWATQKVSYGEKAVEFVAPKKKDHVFVEWRVSGGAAYSFNSVVKKDVVLEPEWAASDEEADNAYVAATWYFTDENQKEHKLILSSKNEVEVLTDGKTDGYGSYFYGADGFVELTVSAGSKKGEYVCEIDGLHMDFGGNDYTKNGYVLYDFESAAELSVVSGAIPEDPWGGQRSTATLSWVDERTANALPMIVGSKTHAGAVKVALKKMSYDGVTNTANDFYRGGAKVNFETPLPAEKDGKRLVIVFGMYMSDYKGGDNAVRSVDDEVILLNTLDSEGKAGGSGTGRWVTMGRQPNVINADWVSLELSGDGIHTGEDGKVYGVSMRSYRDDDFYIDYISYYYI